MAVNDQRDLGDLDGVGKATLDDFRRLGILSVADAIGRVTSPSPRVHLESWILTQLVPVE